jgi:hypothetical protein
MSDGAHTTRLRPLDLPAPLQVRTDGEGRPLLVYRRGRPRRVEAVRETWRIDDEWWRDPIQRAYSEVVLEDGRPVVLYRDLVDGRWYEQGGGG